MQGCASQDESAQTPVVRIGYQKAGTLALAKQRGELDAKLQAQGFTVTWTEFPAGPQLLEALNVGSIDFGHAGDSPPVFAQAAQVPFVYVAASAPSAEGSAILVPRDSSIRELADLRGKRVAFMKGSSANFLVLQALASVGLTIDNIQPIHLTPSDARAAFSSGGVDAWAIWDPFFADAEQTGDARVLANGKGLVSGREFYFASREFVQRHPDLVTVMIGEIDRVGRWANERPHEIAELLAPVLRIEVATLERAEARRGRHSVQPLTEEIVAEQQRVADSYLRAQLIPRQIDVREAMHSAVSLQP